MAARNDYSQDATKTIALETGKTVERSFAGGLATQSYSVKLTAGQSAKINIEQQTVDVAADLFAEDGSLITHFEKEIRLNQKEEIEIVAAQNGEYRLDVKTKYKTDAGKYQIVLAELRQANEQDQNLFEAHKLYWQSENLLKAEKFTEALPISVRALEIVEKELGTENATAAYYLNAVGYIQRQLGKYAEAESTLKRALAIDEKILGAEHPQTFNSTGILALVYRSVEDSANADKMFRRTIETMEKVLGKDHPLIAQQLTNYELLVYRMGDGDRAVELLQRALTISEKHFEPNTITISRILNNLGAIYSDNHDYDRAEPMFRRAADISAKTSGTETNNYSELLQNLGIVLYNKKEYAQALELYERALSIREKTLGKDHLYIAALLNSIANVDHALGNDTKALEVQQRARTVAENSGGPYHSYAISSLRNTARYYSAMGNADKAVEFQIISEDRTETKLGLDLALGSERQKLLQLEEISARTSRTISLNVSLAPANQKASELAALVILQRKGRVLDAVSQNIAALRERSSAADRKLLDDLDAVTAQLAKITLNKPAKMTLGEQQKQIAELQQRKENLESEISRRSAEFHPQSKPVTLNAVKAEIPENAALVEFAVYEPYDPKILNNDLAYGKPRYIAYILRRDGSVKWKDLGDAETINKKIAAWRDALRDPKRSDVKTIARSLDAEIMQPIRALAANAKHFLISPDGQFNLIPFEALVDEKNQFLVENYSFTYLTGGRDLLRMKTNRQSKSNSLVIAAPQFGGSLNESALAQNDKPGKTARAPKRLSVTATRSLSDTYFAPLGGTVAEAETIQELFPDAKFLTGIQATETALKLANAPRILHIATHGFFLEDEVSSDDNSPAGADEKKDSETENPLLHSGLAFAGANRRELNGGDDGILTALEASGLNLWGTKLVVLSACDTGLGEIKNGEGVYGLRRSFVLAGAESLVMSLWSVSDYVTRETMVDYYKNLKQGMGRGAALRQVKLEMLKKKGRAHPFYWAAFIQSGEWANLDGKR